jgi:hypothetical protein
MGREGSNLGMHIRSAYPILKSAGGRLRPENVRLAHI